MLGEWGKLMGKQWERLFTQFTEQMVRNQAFLNQLGNTLEGSSMFKMVVDRSIQKALESLQLPTRKDMEQVTLVLQSVVAALSNNNGQGEELVRKIENLTSEVAKLQKKVDALSKSGPKEKKSSKSVKTAGKTA